jgi:uncharacterized membrane protein (DUF373 family)
MSLLKKLTNNKVYLELLAATILFVYAMLTDNLINVVINLLYFIIFIEIIRLISNYIQEKRIRIRVLIDTFIVLTLREFIINVVKINNEEFSSLENIFMSDVNSNILIFSGVLVFLFMLRWFAIITSPDSKD